MSNLAPFRKTLRLAAMKIRQFRLGMSSRPTSDLSYKQQRLIETGLRFDCPIFIETGTFLGDTVSVMKYYFESVLSVELSGELYQRNTLRFRKDRNVKLWCGNSGNAMPEMLRHATEGRILFWLDAHYSGEGTAGEETVCPLLSELSAIADHPRKDHCILIDDARCFIDTPGYPPVAKIKEILLDINPSYRIAVENDCIAALPGDPQETG